MIGALRTLPAAPTDKAVDYALALISGWAKKEKEPFEKKLEELREIAAHNKEIYDQAAEALKELSAKDKEVRELSARASTALAEARAFRAEQETAVSELRAKLNADRLALESSIRDFDENALAREKNMALREGAVGVRERQEREARANLDRRESAVEVRERQAEELVARYTAAVNDITAVINRMS